MLTVLDHLPDQLLDLEAHQLYDRLGWANPHPSAGATGSRPVCVRPAARQRNHRLAGGATASPPPRPAGIAPFSFPFHWQRAGSPSRTTAAGRPTRLQPHLGPRLHPRARHGPGRPAANAAEGRLPASISTTTRAPTPTTLVSITWMPLPCTWPPCLGAPFSISPGQKGYRAWPSGASARR
jgi:hypothetical protein